MQYKDGKIIQIIQEFSVLGNTYNLNGIDLINAVFFVREDRKKFRLLLPAEYKITVDGTNVNLEIQDGVLNNCISVQVGIDLNKLFDLYDPVGSPDIVVLKDKYNQLCQDMANLWEYIKKQGISSDALNQDIVLPVLKNGETYVFKDGEMKAVLLYDAVEELRKAVEQVRNEIKAELENKINEFTTNINNLISDFRTEIQNIINNFETNWTELVENSKTEIINLTNTQKTSITELTNNSKTEINTLVTNQKNSITTLVNNSKTDITNTANTQITNITNISNTEKTEITELAEEKKNEIRELATEIIGFDPDNYYTKPEIDTMLSDVSESIDTIFIGNISLFDGDSVDCTIPGVMENIDKGTLLITVGDINLDWFVLTFPVLGLTETYGFFVPSAIHEGNTLLFLSVVRQGNDLYFTSLNYAGISQISVKKIRHIK